MVGLEEALGPLIYFYEDTRYSIEFCIERISCALGILLVARVYFIFMEVLTRIIIVRLCL